MRPELFCAASAALKVVRHAARTMISWLAEGVAMQSMVVLVSLIAASANAGVREAAVLEMRGDFAHARTVILQALERRPEDVSAVFLSTCLDIETNQLDTAASRIASLAHDERAAGHARVLAALVSRRRERDGEPLSDALVEAWKAAGRPDLGSSALPGLERLHEGDDLFPPLTREARAAMSAGDLLIFARERDDAKRFTQLMAVASQARSNPWEVNLWSLGELAFLGRTHANDARKAKLAAEQLGAATVAADPQNGFLRFAAWLAEASPDQSLTGKDIEELESAVSTPRFALPWDAVHEHVRARAGRIDPSRADIRATSASLGVPDAAYILWKRAEATSWTSSANSGLKARAAAVMVRIGQRLSESSTILDRMLGSNLEWKGAELSGDHELASRSKERLEEFRAWYASAMANQKRLGEWPFAAVWREWTPDEMKRFGRLGE